MVREPDLLQVSAGGNSGKKGQPTDPAATSGAATITSDGRATPDGGPVSAAPAHACAAAQRGCTVATLAADGRVLLWALSPADVLQPEGGARAATPTAAVQQGPRERERAPTAARLPAIKEEVEPVAEVHASHAAAMAVDPMLPAGPAAPAFNAAQEGRPDPCSSEDTGETTAVKGTVAVEVECYCTSHSELL